MTRFVTCLGLSFSFCSLLFANSLDRWLQEEQSRAGQPGIS